MKELRTWREVLIEQLAANRAEAIGYLKLSIEEYQVDGDTPLLLLALRTVVESQGGVSALAQKTGLAPESLSDILSSDEAPRIDTLSTILNALGCRLLIGPVADTDSCVESKREDETDVNTTVEKSIAQVIEPPVS